MAVPSGNSHLKNTSGGAFTATTQGGTILGNQTTGTAITKALALKDNATVWNQGTLPRVLANGLSGNQKAVSGGTFAYAVAGKYVIATHSTTLAGAANTKLLFMGRNHVSSTMELKHDFGAKLLTAWRQHRFTWTGLLDTGASNVRRHNWLADGGGSIEIPATLSTTNMYDISDGNATDKAADSAIATRAIPGELVMKADFVTLTVASGGDFFDYKAITGM
tara:strand:- start:18278 stop:18940 length:663 start_codon:yes stop_codon:yes gene_type:complete